MVVQKISTMDASAKSCQVNANFESVAQDPLKHVLTVIEKKIRNLDKRKVKLDGYRKIVTEGGVLDKDQECAVGKYSEVMGSLDFAKDLSKALSGITCEVSKAQRKMQRREQTAKEDKDLNLSKYITKALMVFNLMFAEEHIQEDFLAGQNGAVLISQQDIDLMLSFHKSCLMIPSEAGQNIFSGSDAAGDHLYLLHIASPKSVCDTTYTHLHGLLNQICSCQYFENLPKPTKQEFGNAEAEEEKSSDLSSSQEGGEDFSDESSVKRTSPANLEQQDEHGDEIESQIPKLQTAEFVPSTTTAPEENLHENTQMPQASLQEKATKPTRTIEEVLAEVQGEYNFLQDSMLDERVDPLPTSHLHMRPMQPPLYHDPTATPYTPQLEQHDVENLGMGQTTFGATQTFQTSMAPPATSFNSTLHTNEPFQPPQTNGAIQKDLGGPGFPTTAFSTLHGTANSPQPYDINNLQSHLLPAPTIPDAVISDPPPPHIPLPNEKLSGYRSYNTTPPIDMNTQSNILEADLLQQSYPDIPQVQSSGAGDAKHVLQDKDVPVYAEEEAQSDPNIGVDPKQEKTAPTSRNQPQRNPNFQNNGNYRGNPSNRQNANMGLFQQPRGAYRSSNSRGYGHFDSMGHPKNYGAYQQPMPTFNPAYNRPQENGMFNNGMQRRGSAGQNRGSRGYPPRGSNVRGAPATYNRTRTFKQNAEPSG